MYINLWPRHVYTHPAGPVSGIHVVKRTVTGGATILACINGLMAYIYYDLSNALQPHGLQNPNICSHHIYLIANLPFTQQPPSR